jgi:hypothetical protein
LKVVGAAATIIDMVSVVGNRRLRTSVLNNTPGQKKPGITTDQPFTTTTVTSYLVHELATAAGGNQVSCDKNPDKAVSTVDTDAIMGENGGGK